MRRSSHRIDALPTSAQGSAWEELTWRDPVLKQVRFEATDAGGVGAEWVVPIEGGEPHPVVLYLHGGWYSSLSPRNYHNLLARICVASHARVLALDYRLAPEHPFPAAVEDALAGWRWLVRTGVSPGRIVVAGDSAGGGLCAALLIALRDAGEALPAGAALISPWVDLSAKGGSLVSNAAYDWLGPEEVDKRVRLLLGARDAKMPLASPALADLHGLPPLLVQVGGAEMVLDQVLRLAERARAAGTPVALEVAQDMIHDWHLFAMLFPQARAAIERISTFVRERTAEAA